MTVGVGFPAYRCAPCVGPVHHHLVCTLGLQQDADVPNEARLMLRADLDQCTAARERGQGTRRVSEFRMNRYAQTTTGRSVMRSARRPYQIWRRGPTCSAAASSANMAAVPCSLSGTSASAPPDL